MTHTWRRRWEWTSNAAHVDRMHAAQNTGPAVPIIDGRRLETLVIITDESAARVWRRTRATTTSRGLTRSRSAVLTVSTPSYALELETSSVPNKSANPLRTSRIREVPSTPTLSTSRVRSIVRSCETFTTLARGSPASPRRRRTFPGMAPSRRFDVMAATTVVEMVLRLNRSCWTTRAGRRPAGADPSDAPK